MKKVSALLLACLILNSCSLAPKYKKPVMDMPEQQLTGDISAFVNPKWWEMFGSENLNALVEEALKNNQSLASALARTEQAFAQFKMTRSGLLPSAGVGASANWGTQTPSGQIVSSPLEIYSVAPMVSFELDIWGKNRSLSESDKAKYFATKAAYDLSRLMAASNVVNAYFLILALDANIEILKSAIADGEKITDIYSKRLKAGTASKSDYLRVKANNETDKANLVDLQIQLSSAQSALAVLCGRSPSDIVTGSISRNKNINQLIITPDVPEGLNSDILNRRPDVLQAEQNLISANALIGAARADYLPSITLTGTAGYASSSLSHLIASGTGFWGLAGGLAAPIFQGGKIRAENKAAEAAFRQARAEYHLAVENAFKDVYDALTANRLRRDVLAHYGQAANDMQESYAMAQAQFNAGVIDTVNLLDIKRTMLNAQLAMVNSQYNLLTALSGLSKALGGGWVARGDGDKKRQQLP